MAVSNGNRSVEELVEKYRALTVAELKKELRRVGLKPRGLKKDLVRSLAEKEYERGVGFRGLEVIFS